MRKIAKGVRVVRRAGKLFDCPRVLIGCFNAYVFSAWSIVPPFRCGRQSLVWVCWTVLFAVRNGGVKLSFVVCLTE